MRKTLCKSDLRLDGLFFKRVKYTNITKMTPTYNSVDLVVVPFFEKREKY